SLRSPGRRDLSPPAPDVKGRQDLGARVGGGASSPPAPARGGSRCPPPVVPMESASWTRGIHRRPPLAPPGARHAGPARAADPHSRAPYIARKGPVKVRSRWRRRRVGALRGPVATTSADRYSWAG